MRRTKKVVEQTTRQGALLLQPYFAMGLVAVLTIILWLIGNKAGYVKEIAFSLTASTIILSFFTWKASRHRRDFGRGHAVTTMVCTGGIMIAGVLSSPFDPTIVLIWLLGGGTIGLTWNIRNAIQNEKREVPMDIFFKEHNLAGTKMNFTRQTRDISEGTFKLKPGTTMDTLQRAARPMASLFGVPANGVRIRPNTDNESKAFFKIVRRDMLKDVIPYEYKFESFTPNDPMTIGWYEDGTPERFSLHSEKLGAVHLLVQGMNGSGKSEGAKVIFAEMFKRTETEMWVIDVTKGEQTLGVLKDYLDWVITEEKIADMLFKRFPKVIKARADYLGKKRLAKWQPGCGLSFVYLHIEEASGLIADNPAFIKMMETARSVGIQITASLQRASFKAIDTAARAQFSAVLCFGVNDIADANFALPDEVIEAGANPAIWKNKRQGYNYLVHPDAEDEYWTTPARTQLIDNEQLEMAGLNRLPHELDRVTLAAVGDLYQAELDDDSEDEDLGEDDLYEEEHEEMEVETEPMSDEELTTSYPDKLLEFGARKKLDANAAKAVLDARLEELRKQAGEFNAPELAVVLVETGLSRAWLYKQLQAKVEAGELEKEDFTYKFPPKLKKKE